jgi:hypothetical protein
MPLPAALLTTTCDIYRGNPPSGGPATTNVPCQLVADYARGAQVLNNALRSWTHYLVLDSSVDVRDSFAGVNQPWNYPASDTVKIPSGGTTAYAVVLVEVCGKGTAIEHKRVYLDRQAPNWPAL